MVLALGAGSGSSMPPSPLSRSVNQQVYPILYYTYVHVQLLQQSGFISFVHYAIMGGLRAFIQHQQSKSENWTLSSVYI